jgi:hypothetical protein
MHLLRAVCFGLTAGLLAVCGSGCLIGFDAGGLTGGAANRGDAGTGGAGATGSTGGMNAAGDLGLTAACDDFSAYTPGMPLPNWVDGRGTWRVIMMTQGKVLAQTTSSTSRNDRFVAWQGGKDYADASISAVATIADMTDLNCVLSRVQDASNYYALCVEDVGGRNRPSAHEWHLNLVSAGNETRLGSGSIALTSSHAFALRVQGSTLTASVDGDVKPAVTDTTLTHGSIGVSTDDSGGFTSLCTVQQ